jgi:hypothetical protein
MPVAPAGVLELTEAAGVIQAKAAGLGDLPGAPVSEVTATTGGFVGSFEGCDIYYSTATGAHEVHGDIRAKYTALLGPSWLGLPVTDETGTPDGVGRFNHFARSASIYWSPTTGPFVVRGPIRDVWSGLGWETSELGYPVADEYQTKQWDPAHDPVMRWSLFENGAIFEATDGEAAVALAATLSKDDLATLVRQYFDVEVHKSPDNVGLHPARSVIDVSSWSYGFWAAISRKVDVDLQGFRDNGLAADTEITIVLGLRFAMTPADIALAPPTLGEPTQKQVNAFLGSSSVNADGPGSDDIAHGVSDAITAAFPVTVGDVVPTGATTDSIDVIGLLTTSDGGLQILVNPLPPVNGNLRQLFAQRTLDKLVNG